MGPDAMILLFWMLSFKSNFSLSSFTFFKRVFSSSSLSAIRVVVSEYLRLLIFLPAILIPACASSSLGRWSPRLIRGIRRSRCLWRSEGSVRRRRRAGFSLRETGELRRESYKMSGESSGPPGFKLRVVSGRILVKDHKRLNIGTLTLLSHPATIKIQLQSDIIL